MIYPIMNIDHFEIVEIITLLMIAV